MEPQIRPEEETPFPEALSLQGNIAVRSATWGDVPAIARIQNQGIKDGIATLDRQAHTLEEEQEWFRAHGPVEPIIAATLGDAVIGWASLSRFLDRRGYEGVKELSIYVEREWRGQGVGSALLDSLIERARQFPIYKIVLNVLPANTKGIALYRKFGFRTVGVLRNQGQVESGWTDTILMEKHLDVPSRDRGVGVPARVEESGEPSSQSLKLDRPLVVKVGGSALGADDTFLSDLLALQNRGVPPVVVHGGGSIITDWMIKQGVRPRFVKGLRVTDAASLDVVVAVLAGLVNKNIVASIIALEGKAVGISGVDGGMLYGKVKDPQLGMVGEITEVDPGPILDILASGAIPVIAPVAIQQDKSLPQGWRLLNINADTAAGEIAVALDAERLVFLTDVEGVLDSSKRLIPRITPRQTRGLVDSGVVAGGMVPKVEACLRALEKVSFAQIIDGRRPGALGDSLEGKALGSRIG